MNNDRYPRSSQSDEGNNSFDAILKRSNGSGFNLGGLLSESIKSKSEATSTDNDKTSSSSEKTSKRTKKEFPTLLKGIFPKTLDVQKIEKPTTAAEDIRDALSTNEKPDLSQEEAINSTVDLASETKDDLVSDTKTEVVGDMTTATEHEKVAKKGPGDIKEEAMAETTLLPEDIERESIIEDARSKIAETESPIAETEPPKHAPPLIFESNPTASSFGTSAGSGYESTSFVTPSVTHERVIIEKQKPTGAVLAFLGAEFLSRRRDKKIRKELTKQNKESKKSIEQLNKKFDQRAPESIDSIINRQQIKYQTQEKQPDLKIREQTQPVKREFVYSGTKEPVNQINPARSVEVQPNNRLAQNVNIANRAESYQIRQNVQEAVFPSPQPEFTNGTSNIENNANLYNFETAPENKVYNNLQTTQNARQPSPGPLNTTSQAGFSSSVADDSSDYTSVAQSQNPITSGNQYKQSAQIGAGVAVVILIIFALVYFL